MSLGRLQRGWSPKRQDKPPPSPSVRYRVRRITAQWLETEVSRLHETAFLLSRGTPARQGAPIDAGNARPCLREGAEAAGSYTSSRHLKGGLYLPPIAMMARSPSPSNSLAQTRHADRQSKLTCAVLLGPVSPQHDRPPRVRTPANRLPTASSCWASQKLPSLHLISGDVSWAARCCAFQH